MGQGRRLYGFIKSHFAVSCEEEPQGNSSCQGRAALTVIDFDLGGSPAVLRKGTQQSFFRISPGMHELFP